MANKKISQLTALTSPDVTNDFLPIIDGSSSVTKKINLTELGIPSKSFNTVTSSTNGEAFAGGNYTGSLDGVITYYIKVTDISTNPEKWAWSTDNVNYSQEFEMSGSPYANDVEKGLTITWVHSQSGKFVGDIYTFTVGEEGAKVHANGDFQNSGHVASENGFLMKIVGSTGTHLNTYS